MREYLKFFCLVILISLKTSGLSWLSQAHINTNKTSQESWQVSLVVSEYFPLGKASSTAAWLFLFYFAIKTQHLEKITVILQHVSP